MKKKRILLLCLFSGLFLNGHVIAQNSSSSSSPAAQHDSSPTFGGLGQSRTENTEAQKEEEIRKRNKDVKKNKDKKQERPTKSSPGGP